PQVPAALQVWLPTSQLPTPEPQSRLTPDSHSQPSLAEPLQFPSSPETEQSSAAPGARAPTQVLHSPSSLQARSPNGQLPTPAAASGKGSPASVSQQVSTRPS